MDQEEIIQSFAERVNKWQNSQINLNEFDISEHSEVKCPTVDIPPMQKRFSTGKGIPSSDRYHAYEKVREILMKIIPLDKQLARDVADDWERELFENATSLTNYTIEVNQKIREAKIDLDIQRTLPKIV